MHVTNKVNKELQCLFRNRVACFVLDPVLQHIRHVLHGIKDIGVFRSRPSMRTRKGTVSRRTIVNRGDIVHCSRPTQATFNFVCPVGYGGEMAGGLPKESTNTGKCLRLKVCLRYGCDNLMAYFKKWNIHCHGQTGEVQGVGD